MVRAPKGKKSAQAGGIKTQFDNGGAPQAGTQKRSGKDLSDIQPVGYRPAQVEKMLNLGRSKTNQLIRSGELKSILVGKSRIVLASSIQAMLEKAA